MTDVPARPDTGTATGQVRPPAADTPAGPGAPAEPVAPGAPDGSGASDGSAAPDGSAVVGEHPSGPDDLRVEDLSTARWPVLAPGICICIANSA